MTGFQLRAPWYERERHQWQLSDPRALRPTIQKYDSADFVKRLVADPRDSLKYDDDDKWGYPVPVVPSLTAKGRERFATYKMVRTDLRKLFQPSHDRFYAVVVEVFCDAPGFPRAGMHDDFEVGFYLRKYSSTYLGSKKATKELTRKILAEWAKDPGLPALTDEHTDWDQVWDAHEARQQAFEQENDDLLSRVQAHTVNQAWLEDKSGRREWRDIPVHYDKQFPEKTHKMFRLTDPTRDECETAHRSTWFGVVPTFSGDHGVDAFQKTVPMLDDQAIYYLQPFVELTPKPGQEDCPPVRLLGAPSAPFRLADPMDPDGTKNRIVTIKLPDLRKLAARAGGPFGPGGVRVVAPPNSSLGPMSIKDIPDKKGTRGGGQICTFALELFFIVAFFLFLMFLPIVVLAFNLWFLLALRFCIPPSLSFSAMGQFFADAKLTTDAQALLNMDAELRLNANLMLGFPDPQTGGLEDGMELFSRPGQEGLGSLDELSHLFDAMDPAKAIKVEPKPELEPSPPDPLCS